LALNRKNLKIERGENMKGGTAVFESPLRLHMVGQKTHRSRGIGVPSKAEEGRMLARMRRIQGEIEAEFSAYIKPLMREPKSVQDRLRMLGEKTDIKSPEWSRVFRLEPRMRVAPAIRAYAEPRLGSVAAAKEAGETVSVKGDEIHIKSTNMETGKPYKVEYLGKDLFLQKSANGEIELFEEIEE
jgi:hypothetical protein